MSVAHPAAVQSNEQPAGRPSLLSRVVDWITRAARSVRDTWRRFANSKVGAAIILLVVLFARVAAWIIIGLVALLVGALIGAFRSSGRGRSRRIGNSVTFGRKR